MVVKGFWGNFRLEKLTLSAIVEGFWLFAMCIYVLYVDDNVY